MAATSNLASKRLTFSHEGRTEVSDDQDERGAAWLGQFGTTSAPRWPHFAHEAIAQ